MPAEDLRNDPMMAHLLDSLEQGRDIGHYGRLVFAMVGRHFLTEDELISWLTKDKDVDEEKARSLVHQVSQSDYNPPKRARILEWAKEQEFPLCPDLNDPDACNVYKNLKFPDELYEKIEHYREQKAEG